MKFIKTPINDLYIIKPKIHKDQRGLFMEIYKSSIFQENNIDFKIVQENISISKKNVLRGLHFQISPYDHGKLVRCIKGKIFDVAVDIRNNSSTYGKWYGIELSEDDNQLFLVPSGFAHGFLSLEEDSIVKYGLTKEYAPDYERGIVWNDPNIKINWPIKENLIISEKDNKLDLLKNLEQHF